MHQHSFLLSCAHCAADYIPFEGPFRKGRGPKPLSPAEADKLRELLEKLKLNQAGRMRRAGRGEGQ